MIVFQSYWCYRKRCYFFFPTADWCNDYCSGAGHLHVPVHAIAQLLGALYQQQAYADVSLVTVMENKC